jgi:hypothetical protein
LAIYFNIHVKVGAKSVLFGQIRAAAWYLMELMDQDIDEQIIIRQGMIGYYVRLQDVKSNQVIDKT